MAEVELAATVGTVEKAVERTFIPDVLLPAPATFPHLMDGLPGVFINDGSLCVFRYDPVSLVIEHALVGFVGNRLPPVADRVATVFIKQDFVDVISCYFFSFDRSLLCPGIQQEFFQFIDPVIGLG